MESVSEAEFFIRLQLILNLPASPYNYAAENDKVYILVKYRYKLNILIEFTM